jgi:hypothetical protein
MLELITVVFEAELALLKIQAYSIQQYINDVERITIVVNDHDNVVAMINTQWWGKWKEKVHIVPRSHWQYTSRINGWEEQQLLKLLAASEAITKWSVVLDAKTLFIRPYDLTKVFDNGRVKSGILQVFKQFTDSQQFIEKHYNIQMPRTIGPGGVPFVFHTETVKDLVNSVSDFTNFFQTVVRYPHLTTEFHLYSGFVLSKYGNYDKLYSEEVYYQPMNIADFQINEFDEIMDAICTDPCIITASIHRRAIKLLTDTQLNRWVRFLLDNRIITNEQETISLLNTL